MGRGNTVARLPKWATSAELDSPHCVPCHASATPSAEAGAASNQKPAIIAARERLERRFIWPRSLPAERLSRVPRLGALPALYPLLIGGCGDEGLQTHTALPPLRHRGSA